MALTDYQYSYNELSKVTANGIEVALFPQIRDAIANRMREIYGSDIDLSSATADGQYINMESLILNNIYTCLLSVQSNVNPFTASGKYLDILCSLTNVRRKAKSQSVANVYVKYIGTTLNYKPTSISLLDVNGIEWQWINDTDLNNEPMTYFNTGDVMLLEFTPVEEDGSQFGIPLYGPIQAYGDSMPDKFTNIPAGIDWDDLANHHGDIYQTVTFGEFLCYQDTDAMPGNEEENDTSLRLRRFSFLGANGVTTQAGLESALLNLPFIDDVYVLNNVSGAAYTAGDSTSVANHNVYIVLRYKEGFTDDALANLDNQIGNLIYSKLTPGVNTQETSVATSGAKRSLEINLTAGVNAEVSWRYANTDTIHPQIVITFAYTDKYVAGSGSPYAESPTEAAIHSTLDNFFNKIRLNETLLASSIQSTMLSADPKANGISTFFPTACTIGGASYKAPTLCYYKYTTYTWAYSSGTGTLTIS